MVGRQSTLPATPPYPVMCSRKVNDTWCSEFPHLQQAALAATGEVGGGGEYWARQHHIMHLPQLHVIRMQRKTRVGSDNTSPTILALGVKASKLPNMLLTRCMQSTNTGMFVCQCGEKREGGGINLKRYYFTGTTFNIPTSMLSSQELMNCECKEFFSKCWKWI